MKAKELTPGMKVKMADETLKTVSSLSRGFALIEREGKRKMGVIVNFIGGSWAQIHPETEVTIG